MAADDLTADEARRRISLPGAQQMLASTRGSLEHHQAPSIGSRIYCTATFDPHKPHVAEVLQVRRAEDSGVLEIYVHYPEHAIHAFRVLLEALQHADDKRLDEWVSEEKVLQPDSALGNTDAISPHAYGDSMIQGDDQKMTRRRKRTFEELHHVAADHNFPPMDEHLEKEHQEKTKVKNIQAIELGRFEMDTWYYSPYPEPFASQQRLLICEFCLKYFRKKKTLLRHLSKCCPTHPPGDEIYRSPPTSERTPSGACVNPPIAMFEVDGNKNKVYCQSLCLLSKLFLDHKTLYYDVDPFLFYVMCEVDDEGHHPVGYFSKEKNSNEGYNLACILSLPPYQRKGYGRFLIAFSYELSKKEGRIGTPERPLSDLGQVSYRSYWTRMILHTLHTHGHNLSIKEISDRTAIRTDDIVTTLQSLSLIKYWKGDHIIAVNSKQVEDHMRSLEEQKMIAVDSSRLHWQPFVLQPAHSRR